MKTLQVGAAPCGCAEVEHDPRFVALTGGPGAGKTAVLEMASRLFCEHVAILPESAGILFGGGFPRHDGPAGRRGAQRAIFQVQRELERLVREERRVAVALCDRGTPDGFAYWPDTDDAFWSSMGTTQGTELDRYSSVIDLHTPSAVDGYDRSNPLRTEAAHEARRIDDRIAEAWALHPARVEVESDTDFLTKARRALEIVRAKLPPCCQSHQLGMSASQPYEEGP